MVTLTTGRNQSPKTREQWVEEKSVKKNLRNIPQIPVRKCSLVCLVLGVRWALLPHHHLTPVLFICGFFNFSDFVARVLNLNQGFLWFCVHTFFFCLPMTSWDILGCSGHWTVSTVHTSHAKLLGNIPCLGLEKSRCQGRSDSETYKTIKHTAAHNLCVCWEAFNILLHQQQCNQKNPEKAILPHIMPCAIAETYYMRTW